MKEQVAKIYSLLLWGNKWGYSSRPTFRRLRYNQLAIELLKRIFNGYYKLGARLPSTRELAKQASVNPNTMQRALQVLQDEKILIKQSTTGRYVTIDIQYLIKIRNDILEQINHIYQDEISSYGNNLKNLDINSSDM